jgi:hypothetical protein
MREERNPILYPIYIDRKLYGEKHSTTLWIISLRLNKLYLLENVDGVAFSKGNMNEKFASERAHFFFFPFIILACHPATLKEKRLKDSGTKRSENFHTTSVQTTLFEYFIFSRNSFESMGGKREEGMMEMACDIRSKKHILCAKTTFDYYHPS